ncbi:MAG: hypothetical protein ACREMD_03155 [Gemmatimonadota bacterium]
MRPPLLRPRHCVLALLLFLPGCEGVGPYDVDATDQPGIVQLEVNDPQGDLWPAPASAGLVLPDLVGLTARRTEHGLEIGLEFAEPVSPELTSPNAFGGFVDLDMDLDASTGGEGGVDIFRPLNSPATGLGVELIVNLDIGGGATLFDVMGDREAGSVDLQFEGSRVTFVVPTSQIAPENRELGLAALVGTRFDPTDRLPNAGHIRFFGPPESR